MLRAEGDQRAGPVRLRHRARCASASRWSRSRCCRASLRPGDSVRRRGDRRASSKAPAAPAPPCSAWMGLTADRRQGADVHLGRRRSRRRRLSGDACRSRRRARTCANPRSWCGATPIRSATRCEIDAADPPRPPGRARPARCRRCARWHALMCPASVTRRGRARTPARVTVATDPALVKLLGGLRDYLPSTRSAAPSNASRWLRPNWRCCRSRRSLDAAEGCSTASPPTWPRPLLAIAQATDENGLVGFWPHTRGIGDADRLGLRADDPRPTGGATCRWTPRCATGWRRC